MMETQRFGRSAELISLATSVNAEFFRRLEVLPVVRDEAGRDNARLANEYVLLADLVEAQRLLTGASMWYATEVQQEGAEDFARGTLRDCGVIR